MIVSTKLEYITDRLFIQCECTLKNAKRIGTIDDNKNTEIRILESYNEE